jgi:hypothetical protein
MRGHDLTDPANVITKSDGRQCKVCLREAKRAYAKTAKGARPCKVNGCPNGNTPGGSYCATHRSRLERSGDLYEDVPVSRRYGGWSLEKVRALQDEGSRWPQAVRNQGG